MPTERQIEILKSEAAKNRALAKVYKKFSKDYIEVATALDVAVIALNEKLEEKTCKLEI